jgi:hypothetical protein
MGRLGSGLVLLDGKPAASCAPPLGARNALYCGTTLTSCKQVARPVRPAPRPNLRPGQAFAPTEVISGVLIYFVLVSPRSQMRQGEFMYLGLGMCG